MDFASQLSAVRGEHAQRYRQYVDHQLPTLCPQGVGNDEHPHVFNKPEIAQFTRIVVDIRDFVRRAAKRRRTFSERLSAMRTFVTHLAMCINQIIKEEVPRDTSYTQTGRNGRNEHHTTRPNKRRNDGPPAPVSNKCLSDMLTSQP